MACSLVTFSQTKDFTLVGKVTDSSTKEIINYATVEILSLKDSSLINGKLTGTDGSFTIKVDTITIFFIKVTALGYQTKNIFWPTLKTLLATSNYTSKINLGTVFLTPKTFQLKETIITGYKNLIETVPGGFVYNASKNATVSNGTVKDLLKQVPGVFLDKDGSISLIGKGQTNIYINGKPTNMSGSDLIAYLEQLNASNISKVIVNMTPTAKYDAGGSGGIIDIQTKKNTVKGINGNYSVGGGTHDKYFTDGNLFYNSSKISTYLSLGYRHSNTSLLTQSSIANNYAVDSLYRYNLISKSPNNPSNSSNLNTGIFWSIDTTSTLGFSFQYLHNSDRGASIATNNIFNRGNELQSSYTTSQIFNTRSNRYIPDINFRKILNKRGEELIIDYNNFSFNKERNNTSLNNFFNQEGQELIDEKRQQFIPSAAKININTLKIDYTLPINKKLNLESGLKYTSTNDQNNYTNEILDKSSGQYLINPNNTDIFKYNEKISAGFIDISGSNKFLSYKLGLRAENTSINFSSNTVSESNHAINYLDFFPNIYLQKSLKSNQSISIDLSRRIDRPYYLNLNPYIDNTDPNNLVTGNPYLKPSISNSIALTYSKNFKGNNSIIFSITYTRNSNPVSFILDKYSSASSDTVRNILKPENLNYSNYLSYFVIMQNQIFKWWNLSTNLSLFTQNFNGFNVNLPTQKSNLSFFSNVFSSFTLTKQSYLQVFATYITPQTSSQGKTNAYHTIDLGFQQNLTKALDLSVNLSDIFNINKSSYVSSSNYIYAVINGHPETRILTVKLKYSFGKSINNKIKQYKPEGNNRVQ